MELRSWLCGVADIRAGSTGAGTSATRLNSCGTAPCSSISALLWSLDQQCCLGDGCAALLCKEQPCPESLHLAVLYRVFWAHLCGILWDSAYGLRSWCETGVTVLGSCRGCLRHLRWLTCFKPKLIQACSFWSPWCSLEQAICACKKGCWWPLNPIGEQVLSP